MSAATSTDRRYFFRAYKLGRREQERERAQGLVGLAIIVRRPRQTIRALVKMFKFYRASRIINIRPTFEDSLPRRHVLKEFNSRRRAVDHASGYSVDVFFHLADSCASFRAARSFSAVLPRL